LIIEDFVIPDRALSASREDVSTCAHDVSTRFERGKLGCGEMNQAVRSI